MSERICRKKISSHMDPNDNEVIDNVSVTFDFINEQIKYYLKLHFQVIDVKRLYFLAKTEEKIPYLSRK